METLKATTIVNSFKGSGICPLNRDAISPDKILPTLAKQPAEVRIQ